MKAIWMKYKWVLLVLAAVGLVMIPASCGVPREAAQLAAQSAQLAATTQPTDDAGVRQQLLAQDAAWEKLAALLQQREIGGITGVDAGFTTTVEQIAAAAQRQDALIAAKTDDPGFNRQALTRFGALWQSANQYLNR